MSTEPNVQRIIRMEHHNQITYIEIPVGNIADTKAFFTRVFGWQFTDQNGQYTCFHGAGVSGGFYQNPQTFTLAKGTPLLVIFSDNLSSTENEIRDAGGEISKNTFDFPGGKRFHFIDPNGNEFGVWGK